MRHRIAIFSLVRRPLATLDANDLRFLVPQNPQMAAVAQLPVSLLFPWSIMFSRGSTLPERGSAGRAGSNPLRAATLPECADELLGSTGGGRRCLPEFYKMFRWFNEAGYQKNRGWQCKFANPLFDLPFALPMGNASVTFSSAHGTVDKVLHASSLGSVGQVLALLNLPLCSHAPEIGNRSAAARMILILRCRPRIGDRQGLRSQCCLL